VYIDFSATQYNQCSTAWQVTNETTDISAVETILVMKWDWQNRHECQKQNTELTNIKCKVLFGSKNIG